MDHLLIGLTAETYVHPGAGQADGAIDLPVSREATTDHPFIPGSGMKGALKDALLDKLEGSGAKEWFGQQEEAGRVVVSDARLLLLPVRGLTDVYLWATCPYLLHRYLRDLERAELPYPKATTLPADIPDDAALAHGTAGGRLYMEERTFTRHDPVDEKIIKAIEPLLAHDDLKKALPKRLAVLSNATFGWFARNALPVQARNVLEEETKRSLNLWYEETLPPDTLLYLMLGSRRGSTLREGALRDALRECPYMQVGGNETVGQGWLALSDPLVGGTP